MTNRKNGRKTDDRNPNGTFASGNPGRPRGARHKTTLAVQKLLDGEAESLTRKAVELALGGDIAALRLCVDRIAPPRKDTPISFDLPDMACAKDAAQAASAILRAVAKSELSLAEGAATMALVEQYRRTLEMTEIEQRLIALEERR